MHFFWKLLLKKFGGSENSRTFATAFEEQRSERDMLRVLWKIYINSEVVQEAAVAFLCVHVVIYVWCVRECMSDGWVEETNRSIRLNREGIRAETDIIS